MRGRNLFLLEGYIKNGHKRTATKHCISFLVLLPKTQIDCGTNRNLSLPLARCECILRNSVYSRRGVW